MTNPTKDTSKKINIAHVLLENADISALRNGAWQIVRSKEVLTDEKVVDSIVAMALTFIRAEITQTIQSLIAQERQRVIDEYSKCASCGEPLSRDCERCKKLWES